MILLDILNIDLQDLDLHPAISKIADVLDILSIVDIVAIAEMDIPCMHYLETPQNTDIPPNSPIWQFGAFQNFGKIEKNGKL